MKHENGVFCTVYWSTLEDNILCVIMLHHALVIFSYAFIPDGIHSIITRWV